MKNKFKLNKIFLLLFSTLFVNNALANTETIEDLIDKMKELVDGSNDSGFNFDPPRDKSGLELGENSLSIGKHSISTSTNGVSHGTLSISTGENLTREEFKNKLIENKAKADDFLEKKRIIFEKETALEEEKNNLQNENYENTNRLNDEIRSNNNKKENKISLNNLIEQEKRNKLLLEENKNNLTTILNEKQRKFDSTNKEGINEIVNFTEILSSLNWGVLNNGGTTEDLKNELKEKINNKFPNIAQKYNDEKYNGIIQGYFNSLGLLQPIKEKLLDKYDRYMIEIYTSANNENYDFTPTIEGIKGDSFGLGKLKWFYSLEDNTGGKSYYLNDITNTANQTAVNLYLHLLTLKEQEEYFSITNDLINNNMENHKFIINTFPEFNDLDDWLPSIKGKDGKFYDPRKFYDYAKSFKEERNVDTLNFFNSIYEGIDFDDPNAVYDLTEFKEKMDRTKIIVDKFINLDSELKTLNEEIRQEQNKSNPNIEILQKKFARKLEIEKEIKETEVENWEGFNFTLKEDKFEELIAKHQDKTREKINDLKPLKTYNKYDQLIVEVEKEMEKIKNELKIAKDDLDRNNSDIERSRNRIEELENNLTNSESDEEIEAEKERLERELKEQETKYNEELKKIEEKEKELLKLKDSLLKEANSLKDNGKNSMAIGYNAFASGDNSIAFGTNNEATKEDAISIGNNTKVNGVGSIGIGKNSTVNGNNNVAIGNNITIAESFNNTIVLGNESKPMEATPTSSYTIRNNSYNFAGNNPTSTLSIGSEGNERQIKNVAAGKISSDSTDAVNGSQLFSIIEEINNLSFNTENNGSTTPSTTTTSSKIVEGENLTISKNKNNETEISLKENIELNSITTGEVIVSKEGINNGNKKITNVSNGEINENSKDAINGSQIFHLQKQIANNSNKIEDLNNKINKIDKSHKAGIASALASGGLPQAMRAGQSGIVAGVGQYQNQIGLAVGYSKVSDNGKWIIKTSVTTNSDKKIGSQLSFGYFW